MKKPALTRLSQQLLDIADSFMSQRAWLKRERNIIDILREIARDKSQPDHVRKEAVEALKNYQRLSGENERTDE